MGGGGVPPGASEFAQSAYRTAVPQWVRSHCTTNQPFGQSHMQKGQQHRPTFMHKLDGIYCSLSRCKRRSLRPARASSEYYFYLSSSPSEGALGTAASRTDIA